MTGRRTIVRPLAWVALAVQLAVGPLATWSHDHAGRGGCCHSAPATTTGHGSATATGCPTERTGRSCRFSACRAAARQAAVAAAPAARTGCERTADGPASVAAPCTACEFLAQFLAVANWSLPDRAVFAVWPAVPTSRVGGGAPFSAAVLARGPPAAA